MTTVQVTPEEMAEQIRRWSKQARLAAERGADLAAQRALAELVRVSPTDMGQLRNSWERKGQSLTNTAPHVGIVEAGARPHAVNRSGIENLTRWAQRKLGLSEKEAKRFAFAKAADLRRHGQKPTWFIRDRLLLFTQWTKEEVERQLIKRGQAGKLR